MENNMEMSVQNGVLSIRIDLKGETRPSASKKSDIIATSGGAIRLQSGESVNLTVYRKK